MGNLYFINTTRITVFVTSLLAFGCHFAQTVFLLTSYQQKAGIPSWISAGHWQYLTWFVSLGISLISSILLCTRLCCGKRSHLVRGDRYLSVFNIVPLLISILTAILLDGPEPWTNSTVDFKRPAFTGLFSSCAQLDEHLDPFYPLLYNRCLLSDSTLVGAIVVCFFWVLLAVLVFFFRPSQRFSTLHPRLPAQEPQWGRYIPDPLISPVQFRHQHYLRSSPDPSIGSMSTIHLTDDTKSRNTRLTHYSEKFEVSDNAYGYYSQPTTPHYTNAQTLGEWGDDTEEHLARIAYARRDTYAENRSGKHPLSPNTVSTAPSTTQYSWASKPHQKVYSPSH